MNFRSLFLITSLLQVVFVLNRSLAMHIHSPAEIVNPAKLSLQDLCIRAILGFDPEGFLNENTNRQNGSQKESNPNAVEIFKTLYSNPMALAIFSVALREKKDFVMFDSPRGCSKDKIYAFPIVKKVGQHLVYIKGRRKITVNLSNGLKTKHTIPPCLATNATANSIVTLNQDRTKAYICNYFNGKCYRRDAIKPTKKTEYDFITKVALSDDARLLAMTINCSGGQDWQKAMDSYKLSRKTNNLPTISECNRLVVFDVFNNTFLIDKEPVFDHSEAESGDLPDRFCTDFSFTPSSKDLVALFSARLDADWPSCYRKRISHIIVFNFQEDGILTHKRIITIGPETSIDYIACFDSDSANRLHVIDNEMVYTTLRNSGDGFGDGYCHLNQKIWLTWEKDGNKESINLLREEQGFKSPGAKGFKLVDSQYYLTRFITDTGYEIVKFMDKSKSDEHGVYFKKPRGTHCTFIPFYNFCVYVGRKDYFNDFSGGYAVKDHTTFLDCHFLPKDNIFKKEIIDDFSLFYLRSVIPFKESFSRLHGLEALVTNSVDGNLLLCNQMLRTQKEICYQQKEGVFKGLRSLVSTNIDLKKGMRGLKERFSGYPFLKKYVFNEVSSLSFVDNIFSYRGQKTGSISLPVHEFIESRRKARFEEQNNPLPPDPLKKKLDFAVECLEYYRTFKQHPYMLSFLLGQDCWTDTENSQRDKKYQPALLGNALHDIHKNRLALCQTQYCRKAPAHFLYKSYRSKWSHESLLKHDALAVGLWIGLPGDRKNKFGY